MISVVIVDDIEDTLLLLSSIINTSSEIRVVGTASNGKEAIEIITKIKPDIVLMDIGLPDMDGIACVKQLKPYCPNTEFIMCTVHDADAKIFDSILSGASSYLMKSSSAQTILDTIKEVSEGKSPINSDIARKIINIIQHKVERPDYGITKKENIILELLSKGETYQEIADHAHISVKTLKSHIYRIYQKLQVDNRVEAINKYFGRNPS